MLTTEGNPTSPADIHRSGEQITEAQPGSLCCVACGFAFSISALDSLPECPNCHGRSFRRASIFDRRPSVEIAALETGEATEWLDEARAELDRAGHYLAFDEGDREYAVIRLEHGWTRIGRSHAADVQLDDATVSRRHALIVLTEAGELRALDDRSLNGLFVNGERVEWAPLRDGDELEIGRYRLHLLVA
ncbi:MAG TPA: FHA domain-containing protein [Solirubrobacterales bacterium]|nr:FHA domain-containing protein [Solirubrobacterales bacterium]